MTIYVGNLSYRVEEEDLKQAFSQYGEVKDVQIIKDEYSGRSKGFGFVDMRSEDEKSNAIRNLNGYPLGGKNLLVNKALSKK